MRLRELREKIEKIGAGISFLENTKDGSGRTYITNINEINTKLNELEKLEIFNEKFSELKSHCGAIYSFRGDKLFVETHVLSRFEEILSEIEIQVITVLRAIDVAIPEQEVNSISVRLPDYTILKNVGRFITDIEKILSSILPDSLNTEIKLKSFDTGSNWLELIVNNEEAIKFIGMFVDVTIQFVKSRAIPTLQTKQSLESSNSVEHEKKKEINSVLDNMMKEYAKIDVEKLILDADISEENVSNLLEYKTTLSVQMVELAKYMSEGAEVHPALNAPEEVKNEFPKPEIMRTLTQEAKTLLLGHLLEEGINIITEEDTEED